MKVLQLFPFLCLSLHFYSADCAVLSAFRLLTNAVVVAATAAGWRTSWLRSGRLVPFTAFPGPFTAFHCLSLPFIAFHCLSSPFTAFTAFYRLSLPFVSPISLPSPRFCCRSFPCLAARSPLLFGGSLPADPPTLALLTNKDFLFVHAAARNQTVFQYTQVRRLQSPIASCPAPPSSSIGRLQLQASGGGAACRATHLAGAVSAKAV